MSEPRNESQDHSSTEDEWLNKRFEQDFLSGLSEAGLSWDEALAIWWEARKRHFGRGASAEQAGTIEAIHDHQGGLLRLEDLNILVASPANQDDCLAAVQWPKQKDYDSAAAARQCLPVSPGLVLVTDAESSPESPRLRKVHFVGPARFRQPLEALLTLDYWGEDLDLSLTDGRHRTQLSAEPRHRATGYRLDELVGGILDIALIEGRPLIGYDCTFLLPLDLRLNGELEKSALFLPKPGSTLCRL